MWYERFKYPPLYKWLVFNVITIQIDLFCIQNKDTDNNSFQIKIWQEMNPFLSESEEAEPILICRTKLISLDVLDSKFGLCVIWTLSWQIDTLFIQSILCVSLCFSMCTCTYLYTYVSCRGGSCSFNSFREIRHSIPFPSIREEELVFQPTPFPLHSQDSPETTTRSPSTDLCCLG